MPIETKNPTKSILRFPKIEDDFLRVTGQADSHHLARFLADARPAHFAWEEARGTPLYARSMTAGPGTFLAYGRRNRDGLDAPQSDTRDSRDFMLEVPGHKARDLLPILRDHQAARTMQCPRRDLAITARFDLDSVPQVYSWWIDLLRSELHRSPHKIGPTDNEWISVSQQTHVKQGKAPRFAILYDKHAKSPAEYPEPGTVRFEFRFQPEKMPGKRSLFLALADPVIRSWRLSRKALEILSNKHQPKSFRWTEPAEDADLETMTMNLLRSYGPTIFRGISQADSAGYLQMLALVALLQANNARTAIAVPVVSHEADGAKVGTDSLASKNGNGSR